MLSKPMLSKLFWIVLATCFCATQAQAQAQPSLSANKQHAVLASGMEGKQISFESRTPRNYEDMMAGKTSSAVKLSGFLFMPAGTVKQPAVIIVPGSGGINSSNLTHAQALVSEGFAVLVIDPFTGRGVKNTVSDQQQIPFSASTYDIYVALERLRKEEGIDPDRIGAMGYSRGGIAVLMAASTQLSNAVLGNHKPLRAVLAGWPWCGYQFAKPVTAPTAVRFDLADRDNWVSVAQCQGLANTMKTSNPNVSMRLFKDAQHGFGYPIPVQQIPDGMTALNAPVVYLNDKGQFLDLYRNEPLPGTDDAFWIKAATPWLTRGVTLGSKGDQARLFMEDMVEFFKEQLMK